MYEADPALGVPHDPIDTASTAQDVAGDHLEGVVQLEQRRAQIACFGGRVPGGCVHFRESRGMQGGCSMQVVAEQFGHIAKGPFGAVRRGAMESGMVFGQLSRQLQFIDEEPVARQIALETGLEELGQAIEDLASCGQGLRTAYRDTDS